MLKVTTVIVTYNGSRWIDRCLRQLSESTYPCSIIVVDNASTDDTIKLITSFTHPVELIRSAENLGFGRGNNLGIQKAIENGSDYIFLLNQDAYVAPDCIEKLLDAMQKNPTYGIMSPMQLAPNGIDPDRAFKKYMGKQTGNILPVRFVNAAAWMIPKVVFNTVGLFHPVFQHYGEDNHYASRVQFHGYTVGILTAAQVIHDRPQEIAHPRNVLLRQIKTIPLYTLLDIRKPFWIAKILAKQKLNRIIKKLGTTNVQENELIAQQKVWFDEKLSEIKCIRAETRRKLHIPINQK